MSIIEITEDKREKMSELAEELLLIGGKLMQCIEQLGEESEIGYRRYDDGDYDMRSSDMRGSDMRGSGRGSSYGNRRGVAGTGRYSRYRY